MSLSTSRNELDEAHRDLREQWNRTLHTWQDVKSIEFERRFLQPLGPDVRRALEGIEELEKLIKHAQQVAG